MYLVSFIRKCFEIFGNCLSVGREGKGPTVRTEIWEIDAGVKGILRVKVVMLGMRNKKSSEPDKRTGSEKQSQELASRRSPTGECTLGPISLLHVLVSNAAHCSRLSQNGFCRHLFQERDPRPS